MKSEERHDAPRIRNRELSPVVYSILRMIGRAIATSFLDLKHAARALSRQPGFSVTVALTLALGLGINATVLGMMDALLLRPFQFPGYERLVVIWESPERTPERQPVAPANYVAWRQQASSVRQLVAWEGWAATLSGRDEPERVQGFRVTPGFFEVLGTPPVLGRAFASTEAEPGRDRSVVIGDGLWKRRFGGDPSVVGTQILLDGEPYTVVGVAPSDFTFPLGCQLWAPLALTIERAADRGNRSLTVLGRLAPGKTLADAQSELDIISARLEREFPDTNRDRGASVRTLSTAFREDSSGSFVAILQLGAGLVLVIACANLAGLLLARANDRQRELAVRTALGAGRMRIVRQLVTETVLLAVVASGLALFFARTGLEVLRSSIPADMAAYIEGWDNVRLDSRLAFVIPAVAIGLGLLVGLIPALSGSRASLTEALKEGDRGATGGVKRQRVRQALVAVEIAMALALLVASGLVLDGGIRLVNQPGGFDADRLLTFEVPVPASKFRDPASKRELADNLVAALEAQPDVEGAALANVLPAAGYSPSVPFAIEEDPTPDAPNRPHAGFRAVSSGFFGTLRIPILGGRGFSTFDREDSQQVAVVSASLAARFWPGRDPIGRRLRLDESPARWVTVVGVAGDVTMYNWWDGIDLSAVYVPLRQTPIPGRVRGVVRTRTEPAAMIGAARKAISSVDPLLAVHQARTMREAIVASTFGLNFLATLMGICGGVALLLAFIGIYSMMAYTVSQRIHEFGVRMALGATARDVLRLTLKQAGLLTAIGLTMGLALAIALGQLMSSSLFGIVSLDPTTFIAVTATLGFVSLCAAYVPARRSSRLDPATILRAH